jgi:hypothetical protein
VSYLNNRAHGRLQPGGIKVPKRKEPIATLGDMIEYAGIAV